jgi:D-alanine-D-alanine ligase
MPDTIVLFGGPSDERRVSVATAQHVLSVLPSGRPWFVSRDLEIYMPSTAEVLAHAEPFTNELVPSGAPAFPSLAEALAGGAARSGHPLRGAVFFLGVHGSWGEDGTVQRLLEERHLAFTGSGAQASADAFDKTAARRIAAAAGLRVAEAEGLPRGKAEAIRDALAALLARHGRVVAKPIAGGSSVGLHHLRTAADAERAAEAIAASGEAYLCESFISGVELTVGVCDTAAGTRAGTRALPASEVRVDEGRAFDYEGKYLGKGTLELTPAEVPPEVSLAAQALAVTAHRALGCFGYSRTDLIVDAAGPVFLETNTLPGLTRRSFIPQQLAVEGTSMRDFLEGQIELARKRNE